MRRVSVPVMVVSFLLLCGFAAYAQQTAPAPPPAAPAAAAPPTPAAPPAPVVKEVKIVVDNKAKTDGEIRFNFIPSGGSAKEIRVTVAKGMGKKDICRDMAKELSVGVGPNYKVEHYDDDKVKVEAKGDATFSLTLAGQTVGGVSITLK
jgi:3-oxoacyl-ACP reductase-like protein